MLEGRSVGSADRSSLESTSLEVGNAAGKHSSQKRLAEEGRAASRQATAADMLKQEESELAKGEGDQQGDSEDEDAEDEEEHSSSWGEPGRLARISELTISQHNAIMDGLPVGPS